MANSPVVNILYDMKASRLREVLYFVVAEIATKQGGTFYFYFAVDGYSHYMFTLGSSPELTDEIYIDHIKKLLEHKEFTCHSGSYTLVTYSRTHLLSEISALLSPWGACINDQMLVVKNVFPDLAEALASIRYTVAG
jgi:hypothetical protein